MTKYVVAYIPAVCYYGYNINDFQPKGIHRGRLRGGT